MDKMLCIDEEEANQLYMYLQMLKESGELDKYEEGYKYLTEIEQYQERFKKFA